MPDSRTGLDHSAHPLQGSPRSHSSSDGAPILVVEDDDDTRGALRELLEDEGYSVIEAENGRQALDLLVSFETREPFLVVLDLGLPVVSGSELLAIMRSYRRLSNIPVLVISGRDVPLRMHTDKGIIHLRKPLDIPDFLAIVKERAVAGARSTPPDGFSGAPHDT